MTVMKNKAPKRPKVVIPKGMDHFGRCIMHPVLTMPGWFNQCPVCKSWVNCEEGRGLYGVAFEK